MKVLWPAERDSQSEEHNKHTEPSIYDANGGVISHGYPDLEQ